MWWKRKHRPELWKGVAAGAAGGLIASWTMNQFQAGLSRATEELKKNTGEEPQQQSSEENENATEKFAGHVAQKVFHRDLSRDQKKKLGPVVHYGFGTAMGALYGALSEYVPRANAGFGTAYGTLVFAGADEAGLAAMGLAKWPTAYPLSTHAYALSSHVVYGATTEGVRRLVRRIW